MDVKDSLLSGVSLYNSLISKGLFLCFIAYICSFGTYLYVEKDIYGQTVQKIGYVPGKPATEPSGEKFREYI